MRQGEYQIEGPESEQEVSHRPLGIFVTIYIKRGEGQGRIGLFLQLNKSKRAKEKFCFSPMQQSTIRYK